MRLVWLVQDLHIGGGQRVIRELSAVLARRGHEVLIIHPKGREGFAIPPGVKSRPCGLEIDSPLASLIINFPALIAAVPPCDWILCSMPISALAGLLAGRLRGARVLSYVMNDERALFDDRTLIKSGALIGLYQSLADFSHGLPVTIAVNSHWTGTRVKHGRGSGYPVVPHGVDLAEFKPEGEKTERDENFTIATVGRRHRWKGLDDLLEALNRIVEQRLSSRAFTLWVITQADLDLSRAKFTSRIIKPSGDMEIASAYRSADLLVHPSWFEGFGLPPLEAMACGTPSVITDCGGVREYARDRQNCLLAPVRNAVALGKAIVSLMEKDALRRQLAEAGPATAARFTWDHAADALENILKA